MGADSGNNDRHIELEKDYDDHSIDIDYDSDRDETTISRDGEVITTGGGNHFDAYLDTYVKDGWKPSMSPS